MLAISRRTISENNLQERADTIQGDVTSIPLPDASVQLAVSRGSVFFWIDLPKAFAEIYRVLAPGGWAYIGGGFGSKELKERIVREMALQDRDGEKFRGRVRQNLGAEMHDRFEASLKAAGITAYDIYRNEDIGLWLVIRK
jgi:ubiquinone/menaquinone biosynthesis C-methylase UbiE